MTTPDELERAAAMAWPTLEEMCIGDWSVRFAHGYSKRANSANPLAPARLTPDRLAAIEGFYRRHDGPAVFRLPDVRDVAEVDRTLADKGYMVVEPSLVMTAQPDITAFEACETLGDAEAWLSAYQVVSGESEDRMRIHRRILNAMVGERIFAVVRHEGRIAACGLGVRVGGVMGLFDVVTHPAFRRRGLAAQLCRGLLASAAQAGVRTVFLQVVQANSGAVRLYEGLGFRRAYGYWYRVKSW